MRRGLARGRALETILDGNGQGALAQSGVLAALESADHAGAKALVEDLLAIAGIATVGGRSAGEIADRFLEQAAARSQAHVSAEQQDVLRRFLAISGDPNSASRRLRQLAAEARLDFGGALDSFDQRTGFLAARGLRDRGLRLFRRLRARPRLLHRLRLRGGRRGPAGRQAGGRRRAL